MSHRFVGLGKNGKSLYLLEENRTKKFRQVLWGDFLSVEGEEPDGFLRVSWAPSSPDARTVFIHKDDTVETRPLEIIFVDVGQGDGAVLITPERDENERIMLIDAGERDNMRRFLNERFRAYRGFDFEAAVLTHPDSDHYRGFEAIFEDHNIGFRNVYQSGLVERPVSGKFEKVGGVHSDPATGIDYVQDLAVDRAALEQHFADASTLGSFEFPRVMHAALNNPKVESFAMLSTSHGTVESGRSFMPGFAPSDSRGYTIEVLGPIAEFDAAGKPRLRVISSDYGKFKNGHSVLLRLVFGSFSVLFGGDLNIPAEKRLLTHYARIADFPSRGSAASKNMVATAAKTFRSDIMKVCHHGSEKVTDEFLETVNPAAFVISSGDAEGHVHPRPDLLGRLGRFGRGESPVLLSTELQRSTREVEDLDDVAALNQKIGELAANPTEARKADVLQRVQKLARTNVDVYGAIYLKTDGQRLITAFKLETGSLTKRWFYFEYARNAAGELELI
jgi:beta-lactamase superfamily II metal-dependent hydrolase